MSRSALSLLLLLALGACDWYDADTQRARLTVEAAPGPSGVAADGVSVFEITATVLDDCNDDDDCEPAEGSVTFTASSGTFFRSGEATVSVALDSLGRAVARLRTTTPGEVVVVVAVGTLHDDVTLTFMDAFPDAVTVDPGTFALAAGPGNATTVTATLRRSTGTVSAGLAVTFSATRADGTDIGDFRTVSLSSADGNATATFTAGATDYRGPVTLTARVASPDGPVSGSATLLITDG